MAIAPLAVAPFVAMPAAAESLIKPLALPSPMAAVEDDTGAMRRLGDLRGTALLVNFWASWCAPCVHELPALAALDDVLRGRGGMAAALIGVDKKGRDFARGFLDRLGIAIPLSFYDPGSALARELGVRSMPANFLIAPDGMVRGVIPRPITEDDFGVIAATLAAL